MRRSTRWIITSLVLAALVALAAWAYANPSMKIDRSSDEWSRGNIVGHTPTRMAVDLQPAPDGGVLISWSNSEGYLELAHIGIDGEVLWDRVLPVGTESARNPKLQVGSDERLHLVWREEEHPYHTIRYTILEADGTLMDQPQLLSDPTREVFGDTYQLVFDAEGRLHVFWADSAGIQWATLSTEGVLLQAATLLVAEGRAPAAQLDSVGQIHLSWQHRADAYNCEIRYAVLDPQSGEVTNPETMVQIRVRFGQVIEGPTIGLEPEGGYLFWTIQDNRDVSNHSEYAYFPLDLPMQPQINSLPLRWGSDPITVHPLSDQQTPLLVAFSEQIGGYMNPTFQVALIALTQGGASGTEDVITGSDDASLEPTLLMGSGSELHLTWLETSGFRTYDVVYASTSSEIMQAYNALTLTDVINIVFGGAMEFVSTAVLTIVPMLFMWAVGPLLVLVLYHVFSGEERLDLLQSRVMLVVLLALEVVLSIVLPPLQELTWAPLRWVAPLASAGAAAVITALTLRRREESQLFVAFFVFTGVYSLLHLLVYFFF
jgi:hypothetical protein